MMGGQGRVAAFWERGATRPLLIPTFPVAAQSGHRHR